MTNTTAGAENATDQNDGSDRPADNRGRGIQLARQPSDGGIDGGDRRQAGVAATGGESAALISMIERAARDPNVDIDKMERLFLMKERMDATVAKSAYLSALSDMQPNLPMIDKAGKIERKAKDNGPAPKATLYARYEDVIEAIRPILAAHGFSLTHRIAQPTSGQIVVTGVLGHRAGHSEQTSMALSIDDSGGKNNVQGWGSSVSYGKRYTTFALLNIVARGEDDDAKAAGNPTSITDEQAEQIKAALEETGGQLPRFCAFYKLEKLTDLPAAKFDEAMAAIKRVRK